MNTLIEFRNVTKTYGFGVTALNNISFSIEEGEFAVILGPSGAGKSTILNLLGGMDYASDGEIIVNGENIKNYRDDELTSYRAEHIGFVFQFYNLIPTLTVLENVALIKEIASNSLNPSEILNSMGLSSHVNQFPSQLSGGEQQRVSIARAICKNPTMLLCDEPTGALDSDTGTVILSLLQKLSREKNKTVIVVTHNSTLADAADKVIRVKNGSIQEVTINENPLKVNEVKW